jgi:hypothetical protein
MASQVSHLSLREIKGLTQKAIALAIDETDDPNAPVEEKHIRSLPKLIL